MNIPLSIIKNTIIEKRDVAQANERDPRLDNNFREECCGKVDVLNELLAEIEAFEKANQIKDIFS